MTASPDTLSSESEPESRSCAPSPGSPGPTATAAPNPALLPPPPPRPQRLRVRAPLCLGWPELGARRRILGRRATWLGRLLRDHTCRCGCTGARGTPKFKHSTVRYYWLVLKNMSVDRAVHQSCWVILELLEGTYPLKLIM